MNILVFLKYIFIFIFEIMNYLIINNKLRINIVKLLVCVVGFFYYLNDYVDVC